MVVAVVKSVRIILLSSDLPMVAFSLSLSFLDPPYCIAPGGLWRVEVVGRMIPSPFVRKYKQ